MQTTWTDGRIPDGRVGHSARSFDAHVVQQWQLENRVSHMNQSPRNKFDEKGEGDHPPPSLSISPNVNRKLLTSVAEWGYGTRDRESVDCLETRNLIFVCETICCQGDILACGVEREGT